MSWLNVYTLASSENSIATKLYSALIRVVKIPGILIRENDLRISGFKPEIWEQLEDLMGIVCYQKFVTEIITNLRLFSNAH